MNPEHPENPPSTLPLTAEELLMTTRSVRKRLDLTRSVARETLAECVRYALQAPSGSNRWPMQFVIVLDEEQRRRIGEIYTRAYALYHASEGYLGNVSKGGAKRDAQQQRTAGSADFLGKHMGEAPALVLACCRGRVGRDPAAHTALLGSVLPGTWSFMLAARLHGLGTCWTTVGMLLESELAEVVGIPLDRVTIGCLTPVAHTLGSDFRPALRPAPAEVIHWERW